MSTLLASECVAQDPGGLVILGSQTTYFLFLNFRRLTRLFLSTFSVSLVFFSTFTVSPVLPLTLSHLSALWSHNVSCLECTNLIG